jgi:hypothetical protein
MSFNMWKVKMRLPRIFSANLEHLFVESPVRGGPGLKYLLHGVFPTPGWVNKSSYFLARKNSDNLVPSATWVSILSKLVIR